MNNLRFYDNEVKDKPTVIVSTMNKTLKVVWIDYARARNIFWAHIICPTILFFLKHDVGVYFQTAVFCRFSQVISESGLENDMEGDIMKEKIDRRIEEGKNIELETKWKKGKCERKTLMEEDVLQKEKEHSGLQTDDAGGWKKRKELSNPKDKYIVGYLDN